jgi:hypothetical protein
MMLKTLAILAVLYAFLPIYGQEKASQPDGRKDNPRNGNNLFSNPYLSRVPITVTAGNQQTPQGETQHPNDDPKTYFNTLISPNNLPNLGLVAVGVFGIVLAWKTVNATRDAAEAALKQASHIVASERAWIVVSVKSQSAGKFEFWAANTGSTPAKVISIWATNLFFYGDPFVVPSDTETAESLLPYPPRLIPPGAEAIVWRCEREDFERISGGGKGDQSRFSRGFGEAHIYGRIRYFDVLDTTNQAPHETRWLYWLWPTDNAVPFQDPRPQFEKHNAYS